MSKESIATRPFLGEYAAKGAALLMVGAAAVGCTNGNGPATDKPSTPSVTGEALNHQTYESARGACYESIATDMTPKLDDPARCAEFIKEGKIALVNYGHPSSEVAVVAAGIQQGLRAASEGLVQVSIKNFDATPAARAQLDRLSGPCIDESEPLDFGSVSAEATMPALKNYDAVVALDTKPSCSSVGGAADSALFMTNRYADIFELTGLKRQLLFRKPQGLQKQRIATGVHEISHLFGLGHESDATQLTKDRVVQTLYDKAKSAPEVTNIATFLRKSKYDEYGGGSPMGSPSLDYLPNSRYNPIHQHMLRQPFYQAGELAPKAIQIKRAATRITPDQAAAGRIALLPLDTPLKIKSAPKAPAYDTLYVVPDVDYEANREGNIVGAEIYLADQRDTHDIVDLGILGYAEGGISKAWRLKLGKKMVSISLDGHSFHAQLEKAKDN